MDIIYQDSEIIVCIKPVGVLSQNVDGKNNEKNMPELLSRQTGSSVFAVHRLDKAVGGVMVYAKTGESAAALSAQIAERRFIKEYRAIIHGKMAESSGKLADLLFHDARQNKTFIVDRPRKGVKQAELEYETLEVTELDGCTASIVHIRLHTGRSHQIRVQFAARKHPLFGDARYGAKDGRRTPALWSYRLRFTHPLSGQALDFTVPPPF